MPPDYDEAGRDGLMMQLTIAEIGRDPIRPLAAPFPATPSLAALCQAFLESPDARTKIDDWARQLRMNRRRFTRMFRRETGMSFVERRQ